MKSNKKNEINKLGKRLTIIVFMGCFLIINYFFGQSSFGQDRVFDPNPEGKFVFPGENPAKGAVKVPKTNSDCETQDPEYKNADIVETLTNYESGQFVHLDQADFAYQVSNQIITLIKLGDIVDRIKIVGFADGIPNPGKYYSPSLFLGKCGSLVTLPVDDNGLAFLRACSISHLLSEQTGSYFYADILETDKCDIPDGGIRGGQHRKVVVYAFFRKKK